MGVGCHRLGLSSKPSQVAKKQALAAVGQVHLMKFYEDFLNAVGLVRYIWVIASYIRPWMWAILLWPSLCVCGGDEFHYDDTPIQTCAQVLVTLDNLADRGQYINVRNTFTELLAYGVVPVVNENVCFGYFLHHTDCPSCHVKHAYYSTPSA